MEPEFSARFKKIYKRLPENIQNKIDKKLAILIQDFKHLFLHTKKIKGEQDIWEARIDRNYRMKFVINKEEGIYLMLDIGTHDIL